MSDHIVKVKNKTKGCDYEFNTGWKLISNLESLGYNFDKTYLDVVSRNANSTTLRDVILSAWSKVNTTDVSTSEAESHFDDYLNESGYQAISSFASFLICDCVRPLDEKKQIRDAREVQIALSQKVSFLTLKNLLSHGWRWIIPSLTFTVVVSVIFSLLVQHMLLSMV